MAAALLDVILGFLKHNMKKKMQVDCFRYVDWTGFIDNRSFDIGIETAKNLITIFIFVPLFSIAIAIIFNMAARFKALRVRLRKFGNYERSALKLKTFSPKVINSTH
jgi:hypothetical protein